MYFFLKAVHRQAAFVDSDVSCLTAFMDARHLKCMPNAQVMVVPEDPPLIAFLSGSTYLARRGENSKSYGGMLCYIFHRGMFAN